MHNSLGSLFKINFLFSLRTGPKWRELRISFGKQLLPANVYGYVPGFNKATDRLIRNIREMRDSDGYIRDMEELIMYWSLEGIAHDIIM